MQVGDYAKQVKCVFLANRPDDLGGMCRDIAEGTKHPPKKVREALLFGLLGFRAQAIDRQKWGMKPKCTVNQVSPIAGQPCSLPYLLRNALGCLKDSVKVILLKKFCLTES